jgi:hypothetical protein
MIARWLGGRTYWLSVGVLGVAVLALGAFLVVAVLAPDIGRPLYAVERPTPPPGPTPAPTATTLTLMSVPIPADSDCTACHLAGGQIGLRNIPTMAHPAEGWSDCTACHADDRLVRTAAGHSGIHGDQCLACHRPPAPGSSALPRPHHVTTGTACITCHGSSAPLPADMIGRENCWICHPGRDASSLFGSPAPSLLPMPSGSDRDGPRPSTPAP